MSSSLNNDTFLMKNKILLLLYNVTDFNKSASSEVKILIIFLLQIK